MSIRHDEKKRRSASEIVIPLLIGTLGVVGAVLAAAFDSTFRVIDVGLLILMVAFTAVGYTQRTFRGLLTAPFLYVATVVAASFYVQTAPYIGAPFGDFREVAPPREIKALAFMVLMLVVWIALEAITRSFLKNTSLPRLGILDNLGGMLLYAIIGILVAAIVFNAFGYSQYWGGEAGRARLRPMFRSVMRIHYATQQFWFPKGQPLFYTDGLD